MLHAEGTERRAVRAVARSTAYGMATIALCVLLVSAGGISAEKSDANSDVEGSVKKLLQDLGASDTVKRSDAERGLVAAHERYVRMLLANCTDTDAETSRRIAAILGKVRVISEIGEWSAHLSDSGRAKFEQFRRKAPRAIEQAFSRDPNDRVLALRSIARLDDPEGLAADVIARCLGDSNESVVLSAIDASKSGAYDANSVVDALTTVVLSTTSRQWARVAGMSRRTRIPSVEAAKCLQRIPSSRHAPVFIGFYLKTLGLNPSYDSVFAETIAATGEIGAIPHLIRCLMETNIVTTYSQRRDDGSGFDALVTFAPSDSALLALLRLTEEDLNEYGLVPHPSNSWAAVSVYGFRNASDRERAVRLFQERWKMNRARYSKRLLIPLEIPKWAAPTERGRASRQEFDKARQRANRQLHKHIPQRLPGRAPE